jgi:TPR repeat protein
MPAGIGFGELCGIISVSRDLRWKTCRRHCDFGPMKPTTLSIHLVRNWLAQEDAEELAANAVKLDRNKWMWPLVTFFMGQSNVEELHAAARAAGEHSTAAERVCEADFYVGLSRFVRPDEARTFLRSAVDHCPEDVGESRWALLFLKHLDAQGREARSVTVVQCDRLAASDLDPQKPASIPGVPVSALNPKLAVPACEAAVKAAPGDARMIFQLGRAYGAAKDYEKARANYEEADVLGHALATNNLGALYEDGWGVERDLAQARRLYQKAAQAGVPLAITNAGRMAERGDGGSLDYAEARQ